MSNDIPKELQETLVLLNALNTQLVDVEKKLYIPHPNGPSGGQVTFHKSQAHVVAAFTGNRFGKSRAAAQEFYYRALGEHPLKRVPPPPVKLRIVAEGFDYGVDKVLLPLMAEEVIDHNRLQGGSWDTGYHNASHTFTFDNGSTIQMMSYKLRDLGRGVQIFGGVDLHSCWHDESSPKDIFEENLARLVRYDGQMYLTMTPVLGMTWEYEDIFEPWDRGEDVDIDVILGSMKDNPVLDQHGIDRLEKSLKDPRMRAIRLHGMFLPIAGRVYQGYTTETHMVPFDLARIRNSTRFVLIDPAPSKPTAVLWCGMDSDGIFAYREYREAKNIQTISSDIRILSEGMSISAFLIDPQWGWTNIQETGVSVHQEYAANGIPVQPGSRDKWGRIEQLRKAIELDPITQKPRFQVMETCPRLDWEFRHKQFKTSRSVKEGSYRAETLDRDDDLLTCAEYMAMANPVDWLAEDEGKYFIANAGIPVGLRDRKIGLGRFE